MPICRNTVDFCTLYVIYPSTLLNSLINFSRFFLLGLLNFLCRLSCLWARIVLFLSNLDAFIPFPCLISLAKTCSTIMKRSHEDGHHCLIPNSRRKKFPSNPIWLTFCHNQVLNFVKFFTIYWDDYIIFVFNLLICELYWCILEH